MTEPTQAQVDQMTTELLNNGGYNAHVGTIVAWAEGVMDGSIPSRGWFDDGDALDVLTGGFSASQKGSPWVPEGYVHHLLTAGQKVPTGDATAALAQPASEPVSDAPNVAQSGAKEATGRAAHTAHVPFRAPFPGGSLDVGTVGTLSRLGRPGPENDPLLRQISEARDEKTLRSLWAGSSHRFAAEHKEAVRARTRELRGGGRGQRE